MSWQKTASGLILPGSTQRAVTVPINSGKVAKLWRIRVWGKEGMVHWVDEDSGRYGTLMPARAAERLRSIIEHVGKSTKPGLERDRQERSELNKQFAIMDEIIKVQAAIWEEQKRKVRMNIR